MTSGGSFRPSFRKIVSLLSLPLQRSKAAVCVMFVPHPPSPTPSHGPLLPYHKCGVEARGVDDHAGTTPGGRGEGQRERTKAP